MSEGNLHLVMSRIEHATEESPIAVFRSVAPGRLKAVFAATVLTQDRIAARDPTLIGVFDNTMNRQLVRHQLSQHIEAGDLT